MYSNNFENKTMQEILAKICARLDRIEERMANDNTKEVKVNLEVDNSAAKDSIVEVREELEKLSEIAAEIELPDIRLSQYFNGCTFNFVSDDAHFYGGDSGYDLGVKD